jgi:hypothetical protein
MEAINNAGVDTHYQQMGTWTPTSDTSPFFGLGASPEYSYEPGGATVSYSAMPPGGSVSYTIEVTDTSGFSAPLNFTTSPPPNGAEVTATVSPASLTGSGSVTLTIQSSPSSPVHNGSITVTASTSDKSISASVPIYYSIVDGPPKLSMNPTAVSGSNATPRFLMTDENELDPLGVDILINSTFNGQNACWMWYDNHTHYIWLASDDASIWNGMLLGSNNTLQNSQCTIHGSGSSVTLAYGTVNLGVPITLAPGFSGAKAVWERSPNLAGFDSGYQQVGTWTAP